MGSKLKFNDRKRNEEIVRDVSRCAWFHTAPYKWQSFCMFILRKNVQLFKLFMLKMCFWYVLLLCGMPFCRSLIMHKESDFCFTYCAHFLPSHAWLIYSSHSQPHTLCRPLLLSVVSSSAVYIYTFVCDFDSREQQMLFGKLKCTRSTKRNANR